MKTITLFIQRFIQRSLGVVGSFTCSTKLQRSWSGLGLLAILFAARLNSSQAQDTWTHKADFGGSEKLGAVGFSIGNKGYIGTGEDDYSTTNDFWEYDPSTNAWTQKADFGGSARNYAVGFSIGSKGYIGTGINFTDGSFKNDFWEYDPSTNTWMQKANFGGTPRAYAFGFSIGSKGYIGTGGDNDEWKTDFWEYDSASDGWTRKADFGGFEMVSASGFSIGTRGYVAVGFSAQQYSFTKDFWEYDPAADRWTEKARFPGKGRWQAVGFSIGNKGYIGTGCNDFDFNFYGYKDFWEYDPALNVWKQKANLTGQARYDAAGFSIGSKGYIGTGFLNSAGFTTDFWEYTPDGPSCAVPTNLTVTGITSSSAKLRWDAVEGAEKYKVRYKVDGTDSWTKMSSADNSKTIHGLSPNTTYKWGVETYCQTDSPMVISDWSAKLEFTTPSGRMGDESPQQISFQIYPNPAADHASIQFTLTQSSHVYFKVYDVSGKEIEVLLDAELQQGEHSIRINTNQFSKGVYMVRMISDIGIQNQKLIVQ